jgi:uncharacterized protein YcbX
VEPRVVRISIAPVKSLGLVHPDEVEIGPRGVVGNRRFWLLDEDGRLFNNKRNGPMQRIRPEWDEESRTLEIDGVGAHEEDEWLGTQVRVGEAVLVLNGDVGRCLVTSQSPETGETDLDTLGTLARYRREGRVERLPFGVYGAVAVPGRVRVGDAVRPLQRSLLAPT